MVKTENNSYLQYWHATELSKLTHKLSKHKNNYKLIWKILSTDTKAKPGTEKCMLCHKETILY